MYYEGIFERPLYETALGPGFQVASKMFKGANVAYNIAFGGGYDHLTPNQKANEIAANLVGPWASGVSDVTKALVMLREGQVLNSHGQALDPTGETLTFNAGEFVSRAFFGMNTQAIEDAWKVHNNLRDAKERRRKDIDNAAKELHRSLVNMGVDPRGQEGVEAAARTAGLVIAFWDNDPRFADSLAMDAFLNAFANLSDGRDTLANMLAEAFNNGDVNRDTRLLIEGGSLALSPDVRDSLLQFWDSQIDMSNQYHQEAADALIELGPIYGE